MRLKKGSLLLLNKLQGSVSTALRARTLSKIRAGPGRAPLLVIALYQLPGLSADRTVTVRSANFRGSVTQSQDLDLHAYVKKLVQAKVWKVSFNGSCHYLGDFIGRISAHERTQMDCNLNLPCTQSMYATGAPRRGVRKNRWKYQGLDVRHKKNKTTSAINFSFVDR